MPFFPLPVDHRLITLHRADPAYDGKGRDATLSVRIRQLVKITLGNREEQLIVLTAGHGHSFAAPLGSLGALTLKLIRDGQLIQLYSGIDVRLREDLEEVGDKSVGDIHHSMHPGDLRERLPQSQSGRGLVVPLEEVSLHFGAMDINPPIPLISDQAPCARVTKRARYHDEITRLSGTSDLLIPLEYLAEDRDTDHNISTTPHCVATQQGGVVEVG